MPTLDYAWYSGVMDTTHWPVQQILDHVERYCAQYSIVVHAEESDPRGAVCLTFGPVIDTPAARLRVERYLPFIRQHILDGGWDLIPSGVAPFYGVAAILQGYRFEQHRSRLMLLRADICPDHTRYNLARNEAEQAQAEASGYRHSFPYGWQRTILANEFLTHKNSVEFPIVVQKTWEEIAGVMVPEEKPAAPIDPAVRAGRMLAAMRKTFGGGKPKVMRTCRWCDKPFGARELRTHLARCPQNPRALTSGSGKKPGG